MRNSGTTINAETAEHAEKNASAVSASSAFDVVGTRETFHYGYPDEPAD